MMKIGLISDTHSYLGKDVIEHLEGMDEIWHAGDIGKLSLMTQLEKIAPVRAVYGNIDNRDTRHLYPLNNLFEINGLKVLITHIGGYPGRYTKRVKSILQGEQPDLYICGHSHIAKVMRDKSLNLIHMNPGACGIEGFHRFRTLLRFAIEDAEIRDLELIELGLRSEILDKS